MEVPQGRHAWMVKIGEKGQFVIPKEARDIFGSSSATTSAASPSCPRPCSGNICCASFPKWTTGGNSK